MHAWTDGTMGEGVGGGGGGRDDGWMDGWADGRMNVSGHYRFLGQADQFYAG